MVEDLSRVTTLLFAVTILLVGHGLQFTLLPVHASALGWSGSQIGITGLVYFLGFVAGCVPVPGVVARVGHIRSFMIMAAVATVALLAASVLVSVWVWMLFRLMTGVALAGLHMIVERLVGPEIHRPMLPRSTQAVAALGEADDRRGDPSLD